MKYGKVCFFNFSGYFRIFLVLEWTFLQIEKIRNILRVAFLVIVGMNEE